MSISGNYSNPYSSYTSGLGSSSSAGSAGSSDIKFSGYSPSAESGAGGGEQKSGGIGGFFKGIFNGAKNAVKSLMTPKGLLMAGAGLAACIAFPVAAPLALGGLAIAAGGSKMFSAAKNHDAEGVGEGFFTAGSGAAGIWGSGAIGAARAGSAGSSGSTAAESSGMFSGFKSSISGFFDKFRSKPAAAESEGGLPASPQQNNPTPTRGTNNDSAARAAAQPGPEQYFNPALFNESATTTASTGAKTGMFSGARENIGGAWNYARGNNLPEGAATNPFTRTGQILTGKAPGLDVGKPVWTLPSTTAISGNGISQQQAG